MQDTLHLFTIRLCRYQTFIFDTECEIVVTSTLPIDYNLSYADWAWHKHTADSFVPSSVDLEKARRPQKDDIVEKILKKHWLETQNNATQGFDNEATHFMSFCNQCLLS